MILSNRDAPRSALAASPEITAGISSGCTIEVSANRSVCKKAKLAIGCVNISLLLALKPGGGTAVKPVALPRGYTQGLRIKVEL